MTSGIHIEWPGQLLVGWPEIDDEHRELVRLINELATWVQQDGDPALLRGLVAGLRDYTAYHFKTETSLMRLHAIDDAHFHLHHHAHVRFIKCLDDVARLLNAYPQEVAGHLLAFMVQWLTCHIGGVDAELARLLEQKTGRARTGASQAEGWDDPRRMETAFTLGRLYEGIASRSFELLTLNHKLEQEVERRKRIEGALRRSETRFAALYKRAPVALWELDWSALRGLAPEGMDEAALLAAACRVRLLDVNEAGLHQSGEASMADIRSRSLARCFDGGALEVFRQAWLVFTHGQPSFEGEVTFLQADGTPRRLALHLIALAHEEAAGSVDRVIAATLDVTELKDAEARMRHLAMHDMLTDLPNRLLYSDRFHQAVRFGQRTGRRLAVVLVDLDRFKPVNDLHGHAIGDLLLRQVAQRIKAALRESDTVARLGGDEFGILLHDVSDAQDALAVATKVHAALRETFVVAGFELSISSCVGIALYPDHGEDELTLSRRADQAMYQAKRAGRDAVVLWTDELDRPAD